MESLISSQWDRVVGCSKCSLLLRIPPSWCISSTWSQVQDHAMAAPMAQLCSLFILLLLLLSARRGLKQVHLYYIFFFITHYNRDTWHTCTHPIIHGSNVILQRRYGLHPRYCRSPSFSQLLCTDAIGMYGRHRTCHVSPMPLLPSEKSVTVMGLQLLPRGPPGYLILHSIGEGSFHGPWSDYKDDTTVLV